MKYKLDCEERDNYTFIRITGKDSVEVSIAYWTEVFELIRAKNYSKVIIEEALEGDISVLGAYKIVTAVAEMTRNIKARIAFYDLKDEHNDINTLGESIGLTRGSQIKVCKNLKEAEKYLLKSNS